MPPTEQFYSSLQSKSVLFVLFASHLLEYTVLPLDSPRQSVSSAIQLRFSGPKLPPAIRTANGIELNTDISFHLH
jgi:hypothetical protein